MNRRNQPSTLAGIVSLPVLLVLAAAPALASGNASADRMIRSNLEVTGANVGNRYAVVPLDSDGFDEAPVTDENLVNAWGLAMSPTGAVWVANNRTDTSTIYTGEGVPQSLIVSLPTGAGPTGLAFYSGNNFVVTDGVNSGPARFIMAGLGGGIYGWSPVVSPPGAAGRAVQAVDPRSTDALFTGLAMVMTASGDRLYAADFRNGRVDVFDQSFQPLDLGPEAFVDPHVPGNFGPFGIASIQGRIFVTYAKHDPEGEGNLAGRGRGFVSVFDTDGVFLARIATRGPLNSPWGLALAPASFGRFGGDLLVGNFGDGRIIAYRISDDLHRAVQDGILRDTEGDPIAVDGLWAITFGNGANAVPLDTLFFTAGPEREQHGLFGKIEAR